MKTEIGNDILKAKDILEKGGLVAIPTETVYGLAANALNAEAAAKIFEAKNRPSFDPLIIHVSDVSSVTKYTKNCNTELLNLANNFWPGPLTILIPRNELIPDIVTSGLDNVAVRVPNHPLTLELLKVIDFPLAAPSANPFGYVSPTSAQHVYDQLNGKVDYILDGGPSQVGVESTIVGLDNNELVLYRKGGLALEDIQERFSGTIRINDFSDSNPSAPGMLKKHYSPDKEVLIAQEIYNVADLNKEEVAFLNYKDRKVGFPHQFNLSNDGNLKEAASRLFEGLRYLDKLPVKTIYIEFVPEEGLGLAINDRLRRAIAKD